MGGELIVNESMINNQSELSVSVVPDQIARSNWVTWCSLTCKWNTTSRVT